MTHIQNTDELEFAIFCIENIAAQLHADTRNIYSALTEKSDILYQYIIPNYDILHTQGKDYIVNDIIDIMKEEGVSI